MDTKSCFIITLVSRVQIMWKSLKWKESWKKRKIFFSNWRSLFDRGQRTSLQPCFVFYFHDWERSFFKSKQWRILRSKNAIYSLLFMKTIYQKDWLALDLSVIKVTINVTKNENLFNTILKIFNYDLFFDMKIVKNEMK